MVTLHLEGHCTNIRDVPCPHCPNVAREYDIVLVDAKTLELQFRAGAIRCEHCGYSDHWRR